MKPFMLGAMYWLNPNFGKKEIEEDMRRIRDNNFNMIRSFIWWEKVEISSAKYDFSHYDMLYEAAQKYDLKIMETFGLYLPQRLQKELADRGIDDRARRYPCFDRPEVAEPMRRFIEACVMHYQNAPALAIWNLWNEPTQPVCTCSATLERFLAWLKQRYPDMEQLRKAWLGEHQIFSTFCPVTRDELTVNWLQGALADGTRGRITPLEYDLQEFTTDNLNANLLRLKNIVTQIDRNHEVHTNPNMPILNSLNCGINEWKAGRSVDSLGVSIHPSHFFFETDRPENFSTLSSYCIEKAHSWADGKDAWVSELQAGTTFYHRYFYTPTAAEISHDLYQALGRGMRGVLFWLWQSWRSSMMEVGEFSLRRCHDGGPTERSEAAKAFGGMLKQLAPYLHEAKRPDAKIAVFCSQSSSIYKFLQQRGKPAWVEGMDNEHNHAVYACAKILLQANYAFQLVTEIQICEDCLADYKVLILPQVEVIGPEIARKLQTFVRNGGALWADGRCGFLDEHIYLRPMIPGNGLDRLFGCREADFIAMRPDDCMETPAGEKLFGYRHLQFLVPTGGEVLAYCRRQPVAVRNVFGDGVAELWGSCLMLGMQRQGIDDRTVAAIISFVKDAGCHPIADITPANTFECSKLQTGQVEILIIYNRQGETRIAEIAATGYAKVIRDQKIIFNGGTATFQLELQAYESTVIIGFTSAPATA